MALPLGFSSAGLAVRLSSTGSTWADFSDYLSVIEPPEYSRATGEAYVFGEDNSFITTGKLAPVEIRVRGVYVDGTATTSAFTFLWNAFTSTATAGGGLMGIQWAPDGTATTDYCFSTATATSADSKVTSMTPVGGDAADGAPLMFEAVIRSGTLYRAAYAA